MLSFGCDLGNPESWRQVLVVDQDCKGSEEHVRRQAGRRNRRAAFS